MSQNNNLQTGLKTRHLNMIAIAGVIGGGLFVGSGSAINAAGPAVILAYIISAVVVLIAMRMLGEMAVANPDSGSFSTYADRALGRWCGFTIGWLYWFFWTLLMGWEANVASVILHNWFPFIQVWHFALVITIALIATNLLSVKNYGELEFWLSILKVIAIIIFIIIGAAAITYIWPWGDTQGASHFLSRDNGGFMPNGTRGVVIALLSIIFSFMGTEIVTIAAIESKNPVREIIKASKTVFWRIVIFYLGSITVIVCLIPWNDPDLSNPASGPFKTTMEHLGIPFPGVIVNFIVLVAVLSCFNSALYTASRMLYSLAHRGDAPQFLKMTNQASGTPIFSVWVSSIFALITVLFTATNMMNVYSSLMQSVSTIAFIIYIVIAVSQLKTRAKLEASGKEIPLKTWGYPWLTYLFILTIICFLILMALEETYYKEIVLSSILALSCVAVGIFMQKYNINRN